MRSAEIMLYTYNELDDAAKKNVRNIWLEYFNEYYARRFVSGNVKGLIKERADIVSINFELAIDRSSDMQVISVNSVIIMGKLMYKGHEIELIRDNIDNNAGYRACINEDEVSDSLKKDVQEFLEIVRDYAGRTFWQYYKWCSSGRIFEVYGFEFLKDGTPVKLSYEEKNKNN